MKTGNIIEVVKEWVKTNKAWGYTFCFFSILLVVVNWANINNNNIEAGDFAGNSLLIQDAKHSVWLKGNYSRVGFHHPGPAILYCLTFGEVLFYDWLPIAKSPFSGQLIATAMYIAFWLVLMARLFRRYHSSFIASLFFVSLFLFLTKIVPFVALHDFYTDIWMPHLYFFPFVVFLLAASRLSIGKPDSLGTMAISAGFLINGHASFIVIVPVIVLLILVLNFLSNYFLEQRYRITVMCLLENKKKILLAFGLLSVFLLPMFLLTILEYPGPMAQYYHFSRLHQSHPLKEAYQFVAYYWGGNVGFLWGIFTLLIVLFSIQWWKSVDLIWGIFSAIIASTLAILYYAVAGVDHLNETYIGYFYFAVPVLLITCVIYNLFKIILGLYLRSVFCSWLFSKLSFVASPTPDDSVPQAKPPYNSFKVLGLCLLSALCLLFFARLSLVTALIEGGYNCPPVKTLYDSLSKIKMKGERIVVTIPKYTDRHFLVFNGLANYAKRKRNSLFCFAEGTWYPGYTDSLKCTTEEENNNELQYMVLQEESNPAYQQQKNASLKIAEFYFQQTNVNKFQLTDKNMTTSMGHLIRNDNEDHWLSDEDREGYMWYGPHMTLKNGDYDVYFNVNIKPRIGNKIDTPPLKLDICKDAGSSILAEQVIQPSESNKNQFVLPLSLKENTSNLEFRIYKFNNSVVEIKDIVIHKR